MILRLTHQGETASEEVLQNYLVDTLGPETEVFFPFKRSGAYAYSERASLIEGYIFVKTPKNLGADMFIQSSYVSLLNDRLYYAGNDYISMLRDQLLDVFEEEFVLGDTVVILEGSYSNLTGVIVGESSDSLVVNLKLRSLVVQKDFKKYQVRKQHV